MANVISTLPRTNISERGLGWECSFPRGTVDRNIRILCNPNPQLEPLNTEECRRPSSVAHFEEGFNGYAVIHDRTLGYGGHIVVLTK